MHRSRDGKEKGEVMSATAVAEARIKGDRKPRINLCGCCGQSIGATELLCNNCRNEPTPGGDDEAMSSQSSR